MSNLARALHLTTAKAAKRPKSIRWMNGMVNSPERNATRRSNRKIAIVVTQGRQIDLRTRSAHAKALGRLQNVYGTCSLVAYPHGAILAMPQLSKMDGPAGLIAAGKCGARIPLDQWIVDEAGRSGPIGQLAVAAKADRSFPRHERLHEARGHLGDGVADQVARSGPDGCQLDRVSE